MDSILPDFPWFPYLRISDLPEAHLIYAIILSAWEDSIKSDDSALRQSSREWFFSDEFEGYCQLVYLPVHAIQDGASKIWDQS